MIYIIVGLGNPGNEYADTRHNAGRMAVESFRSVFNFPEWEDRKELKARKTEGFLEDDTLILLQADGYKKKSGKGVSENVNVCK